MSKKFLFVLANRGGFNFCHPIISFLKQRGDHVVCLVEKALDLRLKAIYEESRTYIVYCEQIKNLYSLLQEMLFFPHVAVIPALPSRNLEKALIHKLKEINIPVITPCDTWNFFRSRFTHVKNGEQGEALSYLPDFVWVIDSFAKERAIGEGIPQEKVIITGNPHFDHLSNVYQQDEIAQTAKQLKKKLGIQQTETIVVFASEAISQLLQHTRSEYPGYSEVEVLITVTKILENFSREIFLLIKVHPYENQDTFLHKPFLKNIRHQICQDLDPLCTIKLANIIIGMRSMFLIEAAFLGKRVISYQPISPSKDQFFGNLSGLTHPCYQPEVLEKNIVQFLEHKNQEEPASVQPQNATQNVIEFLDQF